MGQIRIPLPGGFVGLLETRQIQWGPEPIWVGEVRTPDGFPIATNGETYVASMDRSRSAVEIALANRAKTLETYDPLRARYRPCPYCHVDPGATCRVPESGELSTFSHAERYPPKSR